MDFTFIASAICFETAIERLWVEFLSSFLRLKLTSADFEEFFVHN